MKNKQSILLALAVVMSCGVQSASAQIFVTIRPPVPVFVHVAPPTPQHIWIEEDWQESNGRYESRGGHWVAPPHPGDRYTRGHWNHSSRGHSWTQGHWNSHHRNNGRRNNGHGHYKHGHRR